MDGRLPQIIQKINFISNLNRIFITILVISLIGGLASGYLLAQRGKRIVSSATITKDMPDHPAQDKKTFSSFAEGTLQKKPEKSDYSEGTHLLIRDSGASVALTSSVVDLSKYEGKKIKVYGETQKAIKQSWLMDVGMVEEIK